MTAYVKINNEWKSFNPKVNINGVWKNIASGWIKINGIWKQFY